MSSVLAVGVEWSLLFFFFFFGGVEEGGGRAFLRQKRFQKESNTSILLNSNKQALKEIISQTD